MTSPDVARTSEQPRRLKALCLLALTGLAVFVSLLLLVAVASHVLTSVDQAAVTRLHTYALGHPAWVTTMRGISDAGTAPVYAVVLILISCLLVRSGRWRPAVGATLILLGSTSLNNAVKGAVGRSRPRLPDPVATSPGLSFPSGHAQSAVVAFTLFSFLLLPVLPLRWRRPWVGLSVTAVVAIGFSRVALGVHYPSDVLAGYGLGVAWVSATWLAVGHWAALPRKRRKAVCSSRV